MTGKRRPRIVARLLFLSAVVGPPVSDLLTDSAIAQDKSKRTDQPSKQSSGAPIVVIVPPPPYSDTEPPERTCWVTFFDNKNFKGARYSYLGPTKVRDLWNFVGDSGSISVGPSARATLYSDRSFQNAVLRLDPGQRIADLPERTQAVRVRFDSMTIGCG